VSCHDERVQRWLPAAGAFVVSLDSMVNIALPAMAAAFGQPPERVRWIIIGYVGTYAVTSFLGGAAADRLGHLAVFRGGLLVSAAGFLVCAIAPAFGVLLAGRALQGLGGGLVYGTTPALVTLGAAGAERPRRIGFLSGAIGLGFATGPLVAGLLVDGFGWRAVFALHALAGGGVLFAASMFLAESNRQLNPAATGIGHTVAGYRVLLSDRRFIGYALCNAFAYGAIMAFLSSASFVFMGGLGLAAWEFGLMFGLAIFGYILGNLVTARTVARTGIDRLMRIGTTLGAAAGDHGN